MTSIVYNNFSTDIWDSLRCFFVIVNSWLWFLYSDRIDTFIKTEGFIDTFYFFYDERGFKGGIKISWYLFGLSEIFNLSLVFADFLFQFGNFALPFLTQSFYFFLIWLPQLGYFLFIQFLNFSKLNEVYMTCIKDLWAFSLYLAISEQSHPQIAWSV